MSTTRRPARVASPGRIITRELEARGWTQRDLAAIMGRPYQAINEIIKGSKQITPETARELAKAFGTTVDFWMNLEANYRLFLAAQEDKEKDIERRSRISESRGPEDSAKVTWVKRVERLARQQPVGNYDSGQLRENISRITALAQTAEDAKKVPDTLRNLGVHFLIVPHLPRTYLDGAALFVDEHPVVAATLRYDRIDWFWFTILHELAHILLGHSAQLDSLFGETEEAETKRSKAAETQANEIARDWLLDPDALDDFIARVKPYFSRAKIESFANAQKRHPGIVLGQLRHQGVVDYKHLRSRLVKVKPHLEEWVDTPVPQ